jgi:hypothetical protein
VEIILKYAADQERFASFFDETPFRLAIYRYKTSDP